MLPRRASIVLRGAAAGHLFLILSGNAYICMGDDPEDRDRGGRHRAEIHPYLLCRGELIGENELLSNAPYGATVRAGTPFSLTGSKERRDRGATTLLRVQREAVDVTSAGIRSLVQEEQARKLEAVNALVMAYRLESMGERLGALLWLCARGYLASSWAETEAYTRAVGSDPTLHGRYLSMLLGHTENTDRLLTKRLPRTWRLTKVPPAAERKAVLYRFAAAHPTGLAKTYEQALGVGT